LVKATAIPFLILKSNRIIEEDWRPSD